jgi:predicted secreted protein
MAAAKGRELLVKKGSTVIAGVRTKGAAINNEPIDITSDDDAGYRTMLSDAGTMSVDLSVEGITKDDDLRDLAASGGTGLMLTNITLEYPDGGTLAGNFFLNSFEETGTYNEAVTFSASLQSSGAFTYTPGP